MKLYKNISLLITGIVLCCTTFSQRGDFKARGITRYVNTFIGTAPLLDPAIIGYTPPPNWRVWAGLTYPGTSLPNAMVQLSPMTEYGSGAGYEYEDTLIHGFTHTNKGHWNLCNIPVMPVTGAPNAEGHYASRFSHNRESAGPGFYNVYLEDFNVDVALTSTLRTGYHRYSFQNNTGRQILFDLSRANNRVLAWELHASGNNVVQGFQQVHENKIYFYAVTSEPFTKVEITGNGKDKGYALLKLRDGGSKPVELKVALSFVSTENAKQNLEAELGSKTFESVREAANKAWEQLLSKIALKGGTEKQKQMFYTSLYRSFLWSALKSDVNGDYFDGKNVVQKASFRYYTEPSLWDTYRNKDILLGLITPDVSADIISSMNDMGTKNGFMPTFFHGDHGAPYITGTYLRGIRGYDINKSFELLLKNASVEGRGRPHLNEYMSKGFISDPHVDKPHVETKAKAGVSKTLEYSYDDYALAQLAKALGHKAQHDSLMKRSRNYRNMFDKSTNFMRGRLANGDWIQNFDPQYPYYEYMYREANAWQVSFFAPHDMKGLIELYGGPGQFEAKLDSFFTVPWNPKHIARNVSSFIGQYCHGNQPDHEAPFSYYFIGKPEKSQKIIDKILNELYGIGEHGLALCGMDDAGEMSAWYVLNALGLYTFSSADPEYLVTVPLFDEVSWTMPNGKKLVIRKSGKSRDLHKVQVNGKDQPGYFVPHDVFEKGGTINIVTR
ncbi:MAG: glycoside hydrolase family 92 protein [Chitinophagaceae bacterium]|nr:MAG: glycoside hydrolase family 92 protein [Chitinophagaceae bacterium]